MNGIFNPGIDGLTVKCQRVFWSNMEYVTKDFLLGYGFKLAFLQSTLWLTSMKFEIMHRVITLVHSGFCILSLL